MSHFKHPSTIVAFILGALIFTAPLVFSFTEPGSSPPGGNVPAPLNIGPTGQSKTGGLILNTGGAANGLIIDQGNVGIGTSGPGYKLHVKGGNFNVENGKVFQGGSELLPAGAVLYFNLTSCPGGWSELTAARGRYIVGLQQGGSLGTTVGTALSNQENRATGKHNHQLGGLWVNQGNGNNPAGTANPERWAPYETGYAGDVDGTNAPYIQLLACQKN
ncbi:MAG: hypothetical protein HYW89_01890 [Candidatus Sungiibacteriota bacterium]|uniref:Phage tail collar domain-containing protein n=1 Tax=Candidatus Sungiibacteriota bacterium TaxID=2750080 RepID=A0A7T5UQB3_9BACT|nr:MAG: hypothetical protein HYW89_01890 [Candidatus Sungbacteria bacterium]